MMYKMNDEPLWNFIVAMDRPANRVINFKLKCTASAILAAIPSPHFADLVVEARPVEDPVASWVDIVADPIDLTPYANVAPQPFQLRISSEADALGRSQFGFYVGPPL